MTSEISYKKFNPFFKLSRHVQFLLFDGEEAFRDWTATDSIYGARDYAKALKKSTIRKASTALSYLFYLT